MINKELNQTGQAFILAVIVLTIILVNTLIVMNGSVAFFNSSKHTLESIQATNLAEAGIDKAVATINANAGNYTGDPETFIGSGSFLVRVVSQTGTNKTIESTGYVPNSTNPKAKKTIRIQIAVGFGASFNYALQTGIGGLTLTQNAQVNGTVYSNGNINMENNSRINGDAYVAGGVQPNPDQQIECQEPNCQDFIFGKTVNGNDQLDIAQSFSPSERLVISKVALKLKRFGNPPDLVVRILPDNNGKPAKTNALASGILYSSLVTTSPNFIEVALTTNPILEQGVLYWIMVDTQSNITNYWAWERDTLGGYPQGFALWSPNWNPNGNQQPSWSSTNLSGDLGFKTYMGGVPTQIAGSNGAIIQGDAHANTIKDININGAAYYQIIQNSTASSYNPGSQDPPTQQMALSDANIQEWKQVAAQNGTYSGNINSCPATLASGKYIGSISLPQRCNIQIDSPIWITGNLTLSNNDLLFLNPSYGASSGAIIVDGKITLDNNNQIKGTDTPGSYVIVVSEYNSRDDPEQNDAIHLVNNGNLGVFYTNLGSIRIGQNNNLTSVSAWKLILENNVVVTYDQGLAGTFFASGPTGAFTVIKGTYQIR